MHRVFALVTGMAAAAPALAASLEVFHPAPGRGNFLATHGASVPPHLAWTGGLVLDFADDLLLGPGGAKLVDSRLNVHTMGTVGLRNRGEVGLVVPFAVQRGIDQFEGASLGDVRLVPKLKLFWRGAPRRGFGGAFIPEVSFPSGDEKKANGEAGVTAAPRLAIEGVLGRWDGALNLGYRIRKSSGSGPTEQDDELVVSAAVMRELPRGFEALIESYGSLGTAVDSGFSQVAAPFEAMVAARYVKLPWGLVVSLGGGVGITKGTGASDLRVLAAVSYQRRPKPAPAKKKIAVEKKPPEPPPEEEPTDWELE